MLKEKGGAMSLVVSAKISQILKFLTAGALGTILYFIILYGFTEQFGIHYLVSATVAYLASQVFNFYVQRFWTFSATSAGSVALKREAVLYGVLGLFLLVLNTLFLYGFMNYVYPNYLLDQLAVSMILTVISYILTRRIFHSA